MGRVALRFHAPIIHHSGEDVPGSGEPLIVWHEAVHERGVGNASSATSITARHLGLHLQRGGSTATDSLSLEEDEHIFR